MNFNINDLPFSIRQKVDTQPYKYDTIGESESSVIIFNDMALKIEKTNESADREYNALKFLHKKLPVPEIISFEQQDGYNYLLMSKLNGIMACDCINNPELLVIALADGLKQLWNIDIANCDLESTLDKRLSDARHNIDNNLVDINDFEEDTIGPNGFADIEELYQFLVNNKPNEDLVFTHGDYCLPNIFIDRDKTVGFLDLGKSGVADRWQDIALCVRSLKFNVCDINHLPVSAFYKLKAKLYKLLDIKEDTEKLRYYILLDELF